VQRPKGLLQGIIACSHCGHRLQSDRHRQEVPLYRERHAHDCPTNNRAVMAEPIDKQIATLIHFLEIAPDWRQRMAKLAVADREGPDPEVLIDKRRRLSRAYVEGAYSEEENNHGWLRSTGCCKQPVWLHYR